MLQTSPLFSLITELKCVLRTQKLLQTEVLRSYIGLTPLSIARKGIAKCDVTSGRGNAQSIPFETAEKLWRNERQSLFFSISPFSARANVSFVDSSTRPVHQFQLRPPSRRAVRIFSRRIFFHLTFPAIRARPIVVRVDDKERGREGSCRAACKVKLFFSSLGRAKRQRQGRDFPPYLRDSKVKR